VGTVEAADRAPIVARLPLRRLVVGPPPGPDRIAFHNIWFRGHNNPRYTALLPRLGRVDPYLLTCSDRRIVRGVQFRALRASRQVRNPLTFAAINRRYQSLLTSDIEQIPYFRGQIVVDIDDPRFTEVEAGLLGHPNVAAYVVTAESAACRFEAMGVVTPSHVVPQGVAFATVDPSDVARLAARRRPGQVVVGWLAAWLLTEADRDGANPLYNVDHLLELWDEVRHRAPQAVLWLVGQASPRVRERCEGRDDIVVVGRVPQAEALAHVANFDVALYPRRVDHAPFAVKLAEFLGLGAPVVAYDLGLTRMVADAGAGILVTTPSEFVAAVLQLVEDPALRRRQSENAREAGRRLDWDVLAAGYERDVLDRYLSPP